MAFEKFLDKELKHLFVFDHEDGLSSARKVFGGFGALVQRFETSHLYGEIEMKRCPLAGCTLNFDESVMVVHDSIHHGEAEPGAASLTLRREERLKHTAARFLVHTRSRILHGDVNVFALPRILEPDFEVASPHHLRRNLDGTAVGHRVAGIHTEVQKHLVQLVRVSDDSGKRGVKVEFEFDGFRKRFAQQFRQVDEQVIKLDRLEHNIGLPGEGENLFDECRPPLGRLGDGIKTLIVLGSVDFPPFQE